MSLELELKVVVSLSAILRHKEGPGIHQLRIMHEEFDYLPWRHDWENSQINIKIALHALDQSSLHHKDLFKQGTARE